MATLEERYNVQLQKIQQDLQASDDLAKYLEEEEEEFFLSLRKTFEPQIAEIYKDIADNNPLQIIPFEEALLVPELEGMFLSKILGYSVLRGEVGSDSKYVHPQNHFRKILRAICDSSNFDLIKKRIGQTIQIGFGLSSDIWITNFVNEFSNKKIKQFLVSQKLPRFRDQPGRAAGLHLYKRQFKSENFYAADFPSNLVELKIRANSLTEFLLYRVANKLDNSSFKNELSEFIGQKEYFGSSEHTHILNIYSSFFEKSADELKKTTATLEACRAIEGFSDQWVASITRLQKRGLITAASDANVSQVIDLSKSDDLSKYYSLMDTVHTKGFIHEDAVEAVKNYSPQFEGLSENNRIVRNTIANYISGIITNLSEEEYTEWFELGKIFPVYIEAFSNQEFNQEIKSACLTYVKRLQKRYTDKRGRDYQDIKKFVKTTFVDLKFMNEKQIVELFKTKRKKKPAETA